MKACQYCGTNNADDSIFCENCGSSLDTLPSEKKKSVYIRWWFWVLIVFVIVLIIAAANFGNDSSASEEYAALEDKYNTLLEENSKLVEENSTLTAKVEEAAPWFELSELEKQAAEERLAEEKAEKEEEERLAQEQAAAEAEEKEKLGYDTGITYDQLARTPDTYMGEKVKFYGQVIQVIEDGSETDLRIAINGDYNCVILVYYNSSILASRVLEDDYITIYGISQGLYTYQSTLGGDITVPLIQIDKIDQ